MIIGSHVGLKAPDYFPGTIREALSYKANAFMFYTGAPQNTRRTALDQLKIEEGKTLLKESGIAPENVIVHAPYIINPANRTDPGTTEFAVGFLQREVERTAAFGARYLVLHPGAFTTTDPETGIANTAATLNELGDFGGDVIICLETMAGKGTEIGRTFEELAGILERLDHPGHYGICLDTCHIHDAGYDTVDFDGVLDEFGRVLGEDLLKVIHLNDSKNARGSHKDRHANIGRGMIGFDTLYSIAHNPRTAHIAKILETPYINKKPPYAVEIEMLKSGRYDASALDIQEK